MKRIVILGSAAILCVAFGDTTQNSFSQEAKQETIVVIKKPAINIEGIKLRRELRSNVDSLFSELEKTSLITEERKELVKHQKTNLRSSKELNQLARRTLINAQLREYKMPVIIFPIVRTNTPELSVSIQPLNPDTIISTKHKRSLLDRLFFRKRND